MALGREYPREIKVSFREWMEMADTLVIIRSFTDIEYIDIKCPSCKLTGFWVKEDAKIKCLCGHEYLLCGCGEVLTEEKVSPMDRECCRECYKDFADANRMCPECGKDLVDDPEQKGYMHCELGCIDPVRFDG